MGIAQLQGADVASASEVSSPSELPNDDKIYLTGNTQTLKAAVEAHSLAGRIAPVVVENSSSYYYPMATTANYTTIKHVLDGFAYYLLPTPAAGNLFRFVHCGTKRSSNTEQVISSSNQILYWTSGSTSYSASIATGTYHYNALAAAIQTAMNGAGDPNTYSVIWVTAKRVYRILRSSGSNSFFFTFGTNTANSCARTIGFLPVDGAAGTTFDGVCPFNSARIQPSSGTKIIYRGQVVEYPGYVSLNRVGVSVAVQALDTITWEVVDTTEDSIWKNSHWLGEEYGDISLIGRDTWVSKTAGGTAVTSPGGFELNERGYVFNGYTTSATDICDRYSHYSDTWVAMANVPTAKDVPTGQSLNGYGYNLGGYNTSHNYISQLLSFDDTLDLWASRTGTTARARSALFQLNGSLIVAGGDGDAGDVRRYNPALDSWSSLPGLNTARRNTSGISVSGYGYVYSGWTGPTYYNSSEQYNDSANVWLYAAYSNASRSSGGATESSGFGYFTAGYSDAVGAFDAHDQHNTFYNMWILKKPCPAAHWSNVGFSICGYNYITRGNNGSNYLNTIFQYN